MAYAGSHSNIGIHRHCRRVIPDKMLSFPANRGLCINVLWEAPAQALGAARGSLFAFPASALLWFGIFSLASILTR